MSAIKYDKRGIPTLASIREEVARRAVIGRVGRNREDGFCDFHERDELTTIAWHDRARKLVREGQKQTQCQDCGKWLWSHELGNPLAEHM